MSTLAWALVGFALGAMIVYFVRSAQIARLSERLSHSQHLLDSERSTKEKLQNEFKLAASETLEKTAAQFLDTAIKDLRLVKTEAQSSIDTTKLEIDAKILGMTTQIEEYQTKVRKFEDERISMYTKVDQTLAQVLSAEQSVRMEMLGLKRAFTAGAGVRGPLGQMVLQDIFEQNDFVRGTHFESQVSLSGDSDNEVRPDFLLFLPGGKRMAIDAKEIAGEYILAQETEDPEEQKGHYEKLVGNIRTNFNRLSRKEYQSFLDPEIPFVVMFVPSEAAIRAAFATDPTIFQEAAQKRVIMASPMTIIPLIYLVKHSWQQNQLAANARELGEVVKDLGDRLYTFMGHLSDVRGGIKKAKEGWDNAVGSWQRNVSPQIEKAKTLGGKLKDAEPLSSIEGDLREVAERPKKSLR